MYFKGELLFCIVTTLPVKQNIHYKILILNIFFFLLKTDNLCKPVISNTCIQNTRSSLNFPTGPLLKGTE